MKLVCLLQLLIILVLLASKCSLAVKYGLYMEQDYDDVDQVGGCGGVNDGKCEGASSGTCVKGEFFTAGTWCRMQQDKSSLFKLVGTNINAILFTVPGCTGPNTTIISFPVPVPQGRCAVGGDDRAYWWPDACQDSMDSTYTDRITLSVTYSPTTGCGTLDFENFTPQGYCQSHVGALNDPSRLTSMKVSCISSTQASIVVYSALDCPAASVVSTTTVTNNQCINGTGVVYPKMTQISIDCSKSIWCQPMTVLLPTINPNSTISDATATQYSVHVIAMLSLFTLSFSYLVRYL